MRKDLQCSDSRAAVNCDRAAENYTDHAVVQPQPLFHYFVGLAWEKEAPITARMVWMGSLRTPM